MIQRNHRRPTGAALVLLAVIHAHPRTVPTAVRRLRMRWPELLAPIARRKKPGEAGKLPARFRG